MLFIPIFKDAQLILSVKWYKYIWKKLFLTVSNAATHDQM